MPNTDEPDIIALNNPEHTFQKALINEICKILSEAKLNYLLLEGFGLDIAIFILKYGKQYSKFLELKAFVGGRNGGVGVGNQQGKGCQIDLLLNPESDLSIINSSIAWILVNGLKPKGSERYVFFSSIEAKRAIMGQVRRGKQNNLRINDFSGKYISWNDLLRNVSKFLME